jgi:hypothetical protein
MTETEWLTCSEPTLILELLGGKFLNGSASKRKLRLFNCACCRRIWHLLTDERSRKAVEVTEKYVDGRVSDAEADDAMREADQAWRDFERDHPDQSEYADRATNCGLWAAYYTDFPDWGSREARMAVVWEKAQAGIDHRIAKEEEQVQQCTILREIFGNPFRPVTFSPEWHASTAVVLAQQMYESRDFSAMPILADSLQDAGCDSDDILNHCRDASATHVRGCWVVDLVLSKS